jgi:hypothetical protein
MQVTAPVIGNVVAPVAIAFDLPVLDAGKLFRLMVNFSVDYRFRLVMMVIRRQFFRGGSVGNVILLRLIRGNDRLRLYRLIIVMRFGMRLWFRLDRLRCRSLRRNIRLRFDMLGNGCGFVIFFWRGDRGRDLRLGRKCLGMLGFHLDNGCFQLVHLPAEHLLRRPRLHVLELTLNSAASLVVYPLAGFRRVGRQTINSAADYRYKISHQNFLMVAGICQPNG